MRFVWQDEPFSSFKSLVLVLVLVLNICLTQGEPREPALEQAEDIFKALDVNGDGSLDEEEFVK